jgi:hypothetical protein
VAKSRARCLDRPQLAAGDSTDEADFLGAAQRPVDSTRVAYVHPVDVDVHQLTQGAALVKDEIGDRERSERGGDRVRLDLEATLPADLRGEHSRQEDYRQSAASTERIGGSCEAASNQLSPPLWVMKTEPLCVPK